LVSEPTLPPDCAETRERLEEYRRGELGAEAAAAVARHLAACARCRGRHEADVALAGAIRRLQGTPAPPALRRWVERLGDGGGVRGWLARPWAAAALAALVVAAVLAPWVRFGEPERGDVLERLIQSGVAEHQRILLQVEATGGDVRDPASLFERVRALADVPVPRAFAGVGELQLVTARPTLVAERKSAAAALRYPASPVVTYFVLPGKDLPMPTKGRVEIGQYKPHLRRVGDYHVVYWKQADLAYLMVSALDEAKTRQLFLEMRKAL
jgi:anti-sigma factor RsiW